MKLDQFSATEGSKDRLWTDHPKQYNTDETPSTEGAKMKKLMVLMILLATCSCAGSDSSDPVTDSQTSMDVDSLDDVLSVDIGIDIPPDIPLLPDVKADTYIQDLPDLLPEILPEIVTPDIPEVAPEVTCETECNGAECGDDGCGGVCGICEDDFSCYDGYCGNCTGNSDCDDNNECTDQECTDNQCIFTPNENECDDLDACTDTDTCENSECWGQEIDCDDSNPCTADGCDSDIGCEHSNQSDLDCNEGYGWCVNGECVNKTPVCPFDWVLGVTLPVKCYLVYDDTTMDKITWIEAEEFCNQFDSGHLVAIQSQAEQDHVLALIGESNFTDDTTWLGLNDLAAEGQFTWTDGSEYNYSAWAKNEPDNKGGCWFGECPENCVAIEDPLFGFGEWNDIDCEGENRYICQVPAQWENP